MNTKMNVGKMLKIMAWVIVAMSALIFAVLGGALFGEETVIPSALVGFVFGWSGAVLLYAFGKLVDDVDHIRKKVCGEKTKPLQDSVQEPEKKPELIVNRQKSKEWQCPFCDHKNSSDNTFCQSCGFEVDF